MPLLKGKSRKVQEENFHDFRHGRTFAKTESKFGKKVADKQLVAVVLKTAGLKKKKTSGKR